MMKQSLNLSRRVLMKSSTVVAATGLITIGKGWPLVTRAAASTIQDQLTALFSTSDGTTVKRLTAHFLTDPALSTLASSTLQSIGSSLTSFQANMLKAILRMTSAPDVLSAIISGTPLTSAQKFALVSIKADLHNNPAIQKLISTGAQLKSSSQLPAYVNSAVQNNLSPVPFPTTLGDPTLDLVIGDFAAVRLSPAFSNLATALAPIMQSPAFISFLQAQPPEVLVNVIPIGIRLALLLPNDRDPGLTDAQRGLLELFIAVGGAILAIVSLPEELLTLGILGLIYALEFAGALLGFDDLFKGIDCDFDGDPNDPNDVPGIECP